MRLTLLLHGNQLLGELLKNHLIILLFFTLTFPQIAFTQQNAPDHENNVNKLTAFLNDPKKAETAAILSVAAMGYAVSHLLFNLDGQDVSKRHLQAVVHNKMKFNLTEFAIVNHDQYLDNFITLRINNPDYIPETTNLNALLDEIKIGYSKAQNKFSIYDNILLNKKELISLVQSLQYYWPENKTIEQKYVHRILQLIRTCNGKFVVSFLRHYGRDILHDTNWNQVVKFISKPSTIHSIRYIKYPWTEANPSLADIYFEELHKPEFESTILKETGLTPKPQIRSKIQSPEAKALLEKIERHQQALVHTKNRVLKQKIFSAAGIGLATFIYIYDIWNDSESATSALNSFNITSQELLLMAATDQPSLIQIASSDPTLTKALVHWVDVVTKTDENIRKIVNLSSAEILK
jgi:hypothetical protein